MKLKRISLIFLSLVMVLSSVIVAPISAEGSEEAIIPTLIEGADESNVGYSADRVVKTEGATQTMTQYKVAVEAGEELATVISVSSAAELVMLSDLVTANSQNFSGKTVYLTQDIDMSEVAFNGIGSARYTPSKVYKPFKGTFNGNGYTISNASIVPNQPENSGAGTADVPFYYMVGFFGAVEGATIKNLILEDLTVTATLSNVAWGGGVGGVVGGFGGGNNKLSNIAVTEDSVVTSTGAGAAAGFVGYAGGNNAVSTIEYCEMDGEVICANENSFAGGFVGFLFDTHTVGIKVVNSVNNATIKAKANNSTTAAGGFVGRIHVYPTHQELSFENCVNNGAIVSDYPEAWTGGFIGYIRSTGTAANKVTLKDCTNNYVFVDMAVRMGNGQQMSRVNDFCGLLVEGNKGGNDPAYIVATATDSRVTYTQTNCKGANQGYNEAYVVKANLDSAVKITAETDAAAVAAATGGVFYVEDAAGLLQVNALVAANAAVFLGKTIYFKNDIDFQGGSWTPMLNFQGTIDGQGYRIKNLVCDTPSTNFVGFLGNVYASCKVMNLIMDSTCIFRTTSGTGYVGSIAGHAGSAIIFNCMNEATAIAKVAAGGIANGQQAYIYYCTNKGNVVSFGNGRVAGIHAGTAVSGGHLIGNVNEGTVACQQSNKGNSTNVAAGIACFHGFETSIVTNNANYGTVMSGNGAACGIIYVGVYNHATNGIQIKSQYIYGNTNYGSVSSDNNGATMADPIIGFTNNAEQKAAAVVFGNTAAESYVGYNADRINKISDFTYITDITDAFTFDVTVTGDEVTVAKNVPIVKITDFEGVRMFSIVAAYKPTALQFTAVVLANDIDMSGSIYNYMNGYKGAANTFMPVGWAADANAGMTSFNTTYQSQAAYYCGLFDGQGYAIKNWAVQGPRTEARNNVIGFFNYAQNAVIQNIVFDESNEIKGYEVANYNPIVYTLYSHVNNVHSKMSTAVENGVRAAGIVGLANYTSVVNCTNDGNLSGYMGVGGIVGVAQCGTIANNRNNGMIFATWTNEDAKYADRNTSANIAGGIVGISNGANLKVFNNVNNGAIVVRNDWLDSDDNRTYVAIAGAIIGRSAATTYVAGNVNYHGVFKGENRTDNLGYMWNNCLESDTTAIVTVDANVVTTNDTVMMKEMLTAKYQFNEDGEVRLITTVDGLNFKGVGFMITVDGETETVTLDEVYSSILANEDTVTADAIGADTSAYVAVTTMTLTKDIKVQAFVTTCSGETFYGEQITVVAPTTPAPAPAPEA